MAGPRRLLRVLIICDSKCPLDEMLLRGNAEAETAEPVPGYELKT